MARVARSTTIPISGGERLVGRFELSKVLESQAIQIVQPALGRVGGLLEGKKIAAMAEAHYAQFAPHLYAGPIEAAANIQLSATLPNFLILESIDTFDGFFNDLLVNPIDWDEGYVNVPDRPGLGYELNEELCDANPYEGIMPFPPMAESPIF
jgi:2-dehydro-3-deoxyphosphogalactonate aldolase